MFVWRFLINMENIMGSVRSEAQLVQLGLKQGEKIETKTSKDGKSVYAKIPAFPAGANEPTYVTLFGAENIAKAQTALDAGGKAVINASFDFTFYEKEGKKNSNMDVVVYNIDSFVNGATDVDPKQPKAGFHSVMSCNLATAEGERKDNRFTVALYPLVSKEHQKDNDSAIFVTFFEDEANAMEKLVADNVNRAERDYFEVDVNTELSKSKEGKVYVNHVGSNAVVKHGKAPETAAAPAKPEADVDAPAPM